MLLAAKGDDQQQVGACGSLYHTAGAPPQEAWLGGQSPSRGHGVVHEPPPRHVALCTEYVGVTFMRPGRPVPCPCSEQPIQR